MEKGMENMHTDSGVWGIHEASTPPSVQRTRECAKRSTKQATKPTTRRRTYRTDHPPNQINYCQSNKTSSVPNVRRTNQRIDRPPDESKTSRPCDEPSDVPTVRRDTYQTDRWTNPAAWLTSGKTKSVVTAWSSRTSNEKALQPTDEQSNVLTVKRTI